MPVFSDEYRYIFVCVPLSASTSVSHTLVDCGVGEWVPKDYIRDGKGGIVVDRKHATIRQLRTHKLMPSEKIDSYFKFASVRNPYDRVLSEYWKMRKFAQMDNPPWYFDKNGRHAQLALLDFPDYCSERFSNRQPQPLTSVGIDDIDFYMRVEQLANDFATVKRKLGLPKIELQSTNVTRKIDVEDYRPYYDSVAKACVGRFYKEIIEHFDYEF